MSNLYLKKAYDIFPNLLEKCVYKSEKEYILNAGDAIVVDFDSYNAGYFEFELARYRIFLDAPVKLSFKFCETKKELDDDFDKYRGVLSSSWLQQETVTYDYVGKYKLLRRYAARYVKITVLATPQTFVLKNLCFTAVTSADDRLLENISTEEKLLNIDKISVHTLRNCMQRVFEDGPKRDRRLWLGDLRLEALTNYVTFRNVDLVKRCLYLFAACDKNKYGFIPTHVYDYPEFYNGDWSCVDYALMFCVTLCDLYVNTGDKDTFTELYKVAKEQLDACDTLVDEFGVIPVKEGANAFIDWCPGLIKQTSLNGVYLYTLKCVCDCLKRISHPDFEAIDYRYKKLQKSVVEHFFDNENNRFNGGKNDNQYSVHSAVWMILGGAVDSEKGKDLLYNVLNDKNSIKPFTPYMHHYVVEAMVKLQLLDEAKEYIKSYWGDMVKKGDDTFYEVFVPDNDDFSPYNDRMINSACHAWSCTPSYFIRKYFI